MMRMRMTNVARTPFATLIPSIILKCRDKIMTKMEEENMMETKPTSIQTFTLQTHAHE